MEKEFVPYDIAVKLKKIGFDAECIAFYNGRFLNWLIDDNNGMDCPAINPNIDVGDCIKSPLWQQAFDWFRENYNYCGNIHSSVGGWVVSVYEHYLLSEDSYTLRNITGHPSKHYYEYQEARQACLEKLIEIVETK